MSPITVDIKLNIVHDKELYILLCSSRIHNWKNLIGEFLQYNITTYKNILDKLNKINALSLVFDL